MIVLKIIMYILYLGLFIFISSYLGKKANERNQRYNQFWSNFEAELETIRRCMNSISCDILRIAQDYQILKHFNIKFEKKDSE